MSDNDVFTQENTNNVKTDEGTLLDNDVGSGKKYATMDDFVKGYVDSQSHIETIQTENKDLREQADSAKGIQDVLDALDTSTLDESKTKTVSPEEIAKLVDKSIQNHDTQSIAIANITEVNNALVVRFGDKAKDVLSQKAAELGMSVEDMKYLSSQSPKAVLAYFPQEVVDNSSPTRTAVNTEALNITSAQGEGTTYAWYAEKRVTMNKEKPGSGDEWMNSSKINTTMMKTAKEVGEDKFFN